MRETTRFWRQGWLLLLPFFVFFLLFWVAPLIGGLKMSLYSNSLLEPAHFVGLAHYKEIFTGSERLLYLQALRNTFVYTFCTLALVIPFALILAQCLWTTYRRFRSICTFFLLLPGLTPPMVLAILFLLVFHGNDGILNRLFVVPFGLKPINWIEDPRFIMTGFVIVAIWRWTGFIAFFFLAGMEAIPATLFEAAHLETNSRWRVFWSVTLPSLRHVLLFVAVYLVVDAFSTFSGSYELLNGSGGTKNAGLLMVTYSYRQAFNFLHFGTGAAISLSMAPLLLFALWLCFLRPRIRSAAGNNGSQAS